MEKTEKNVEKKKKKRKTQKEKKGVFWCLGPTLKHWLTLIMETCGSLPLRHSGLCYKNIPDYITY